MINEEAKAPKHFESLERFVFIQGHPPQNPKTFRLPPMHRPSLAHPVQLNEQNSVPHTTPGCLVVELKQSNVYNHVASQFKFEACLQKTRNALMTIRPSNDQLLIVNGSWLKAHSWGSARASARPPTRILETCLNELIKNQPQPES